MSRESVARDIADQMGWDMRDYRGPRDDEPENLSGADQREEMEMAEKVTVFQALTAVRATLAKEGISKDRKNKEQNYSFRGIDDMYNVISPLLAEHGITVVPQYTERVMVERLTAAGKPLFNVTVTGRFSVFGPVGDMLEFGPFFGEAMDTADKATNKAMSAAFKYFWMQALTIPTEGDNDADSTTHEVAAMTPAEKKILSSLSDVATEGTAKLKDAWKALPEKTRERLKEELPKLKELAAKNDATAKTPEPAAA